jgi:hydroxypyruvate reductase
VNPDRFLTHSLRDPRLTRIIAAALDAVEPGRLVSECLDRTPLPAHGRLFLLGIGKAAEPMAWAAADSQSKVSGILIVTKEITELPPRGAAVSATMASTARPRMQVITGGHPVPDERSLSAGTRVLEFISDLEAEDLLMVLVSGGGSALAIVPPDGVVLGDLQSISTSLLASGAGVEEVNIVRRHLDRLKGGGLARATRATILGLILSDVVGDRLETIGSGPTVADSTSPQDALHVLRKYQMPIPQSVETALVRRLPPIPAGAFDRVQNIMVGNNQTAVEAARRHGVQEGFDVKIVRSEVQGEARLVGQHLANSLRVETKVSARPFCRIAGGETTVKLHENGLGGRNQELALAAVDPLDGMECSLLIALATDGNDGPTDAAGAVVTGESRQRAELLGNRSQDFLLRHDSYHFFSALGDLLRPGYTSTNVNDLILMFGL